jgi:hypothetical protein
VPDYQFALEFTLESGLDTVGARIPPETRRTPAEVRTLLEAQLAASAGREDEPQLTWSNSQGRAYRDCPRSRYWASLAADGWRKGALAVAKVAHRLKLLTGLDLAAGNAVHDRATECASAVRKRVPLPPLRRMREQCTGYMRFLWLTSRDRFDEWMKYPTRSSMFMERYYGVNFTAARGRQVKERMERALVSLADLSLWAELAACDPTTIHTPEKKTGYVLPDVLGVEPVLVWAVPDLVFRLPDGGRWVVCDFKTGRVSDPAAYAAARQQIEGYCVWLRYGLKVLGPDDDCEGRLLSLSDGVEETWVISARDIDRAEERIRNEALILDAARERADLAARISVRDLASGTSDVDAAAVAEAARRATYAMTPNRTRCGHCAFRELCAPEQAAEELGSADTRAA